MTQSLCVGLAPSSPTIPHVHVEPHVTTAPMGPFVIAVAGFLEGVRKGCAGVLGVVSRAGLLWNLVYMSAIV